MIFQIFDLDFSILGNFRSRFLGDSDLRFRSSETFKWSVPDAGLELWGPRERFWVTGNASESPGTL